VRPEQGHTYSRRRFSGRDKRGATGSRLDERKIKTFRAAGRLGLLTTGQTRHPGRLSGKGRSAGGRGLRTAAGHPARARLVAMAGLRLCQTPNGLHLHGRHAEYRQKEPC
jgi:hypothetical protein